MRNEPGVNHREVRSGARLCISHQYLPSPPLRPLHPMERERERGSAKPGCTLTQRFAKRDSQHPLVLRLSLKFISTCSSLQHTPNLESITLNIPQCWIQSYTLPPVIHLITCRDSAVTALLPLISTACWWNNWTFHPLLKPLAVAYTVIFLAVFKNDTVVCQHWKRLRGLRCIVSNTQARLFCFFGSKCCIKCFPIFLLFLAQFCSLCYLGPQVKHKCTC